MRYSHILRSVRQKKHVLATSVVFTGLVVVMIAVLGISVVDTGRFFGGFGLSFLRVVVAYLISLGIASILGLVIHFSKKIEGWLVPVLDVLQSFPSFALFPLLILWLGRSSAVTVIILVVAMVWPILFAILAAQKQLRPDLIEAATLFGARKHKYLLWVLLPLLAPAVVTGSIVAWGEAWETIIAAEIIVMLPGVGSYLGGLTNTPTLITGIVILLGLLFILNNYLWLPLLNSVTEYQND